MKGTCPTGATIPFHFYSRKRGKCQALSQSLVTAAMWLASTLSPASAVLTLKDTRHDVWLATNANADGGTT